MKILIFLAVAAFFAVTPVYLYETFVTSELNSLAENYRSFDQTAQNVANAPAPSN